MNKIFALILVLIIALALVACGEDVGGSPIGGNSNTATGNSPENNNGPADGTQNTTTPPETTHTHSWSDATCTAPKTCATCGATEGNVADHTPVTDPAVAATCSTPGKTEGSHCSLCSAIITEQTEIAASGHTFSDETCSICGAQKPSDGLALTLDPTGSYYEVTGIGTCEDINIVIPDIYNGLPVQSIGNGAFLECYSLISISIPDSITSIGVTAFSACESLTSITLPNGLISIGGSAFQACESLTSITIPDSVTETGTNLFHRCKSLTSITMPDHFIVKAGFFYECESLTSIVLSDDTVGIQALTFSGCKSLTSITIPDKVFSIGQEAFYACEGLTGISLPAGILGIGPKAFALCSNLTSITFAGMMEQWKAITLDTDWNQSIPATEVICSDGTVSIAP